MKTITLSLSTFVKAVLHGEHYVPIYDKDLAELLTLLSKDQEVYHIQNPGPDNPDLDYPMLWSCHQWRISTESWKAAKERDDRERIARWIKQKNVTIIAKQILRFALVTDDQANLLAHRWLNRKDFQRIKDVGVTKLAEKESDL